MPEKLFFLISLLLLTRCGTSPARKDTMAPSQVDVTGPFTIKYQTYGGAFGADANGRQCAEQTLVTVSRKNANVVHFCAPLDDNRIIYQGSAEQDDASLASILDALSYTTLDGNIDIGTDDLLADDTYFSLDAQTTSKHLSVTGGRYGGAMTDPLKKLVTSLESLAATVLDKLF